nr:MAG TPA: hypothetical protein [Caudoviricetes sp.]
MHTIKARAMYPGFFFLAFLPCMAFLLCYRSASALLFFSIP